MKARLLLAASILGCFAQPPASPFQDETLHYNVNWPSGLSLGEGQLRARRVQGAAAEAHHWEFELTLEASIPGFQVIDRFRSLATAEFCSLELEKSSTHGKRKTQEKSSFDANRSLVTRVTSGGGASESPIGTCAKDALAFVYHLRQQLAQGRQPPAQKVWLGAGYDVRLQYAGVQSLPRGDTRVEADRLLVTFKGPASEMTFEMFFARDPARTLMLVKVPFLLGTFAMELAR